MAYYRAPDPINSTFFIPGSNTPGNGVQVFFYSNLSSTKVTVYKDSAGATPWGNPATLDSGGSWPSGGQVYILAGQTLTVKYAPANDSDPPLSPYITINDVMGVNDVSAAASQWIAGPTPTFVSATQFTLVGDQTATFQLGRRITYTVTGGTGYARISGSTFGVVTTVTVVPDSIPLDSGLSAVSYALLSATSPSVPVINPYVGRPSGRLTASSGVPITNIDIGTQTLFFTPFEGNTIEIYDGTTYWNKYNFVEVSLTVPNTSNTVYDVFAYAVSSAVQLSTAVWSNTSTRATSSALVSQNGVYVRTGDLTQRYVGTFATGSTSGFVPDTKLQRRVFNAYNAVERELYFTSSVTWVNSSNIYRPANNNTTYRVDFVYGLQEKFVSINLRCMGAESTGDDGVYSPGLALDSITSTDPLMIVQQELAHVSSFGGKAIGHGNATWEGYPPLGIHFIQWLERTTGSGSTQILMNRPGGILGKIYG